MREAIQESDLGMTFEWTRVVFNPGSTIPGYKQVSLSSALCAIPPESLRIPTWGHKYWK